MDAILTVILVMAVGYLYGLYKDGNVLNFLGKSKNDKILDALLKSLKKKVKHVPEHYEVIDE